MRVALVDSGLGLLPTAGWLRHLRPDLDLDLHLDPEGMPWGDRAGEWIVERVLAAAARAVARGAAAVVVPCNTASVTALVPLRAALEPDVPVVGTVPAVKPAAGTGAPFAIWATERTAHSDYQRGLVDLFAAPGQAAAVACPGLADAVEHGDPAAVAAAVAVAVARTPARCRGVVLGCTHYPLVADAVAGALPPGTTLFDSSRAVAGQALRRLGLPPAPIADPGGHDGTGRHDGTARHDGTGRGGAGRGGEPAGTVDVLLSGEPGVLPAAALRYPVGAALAAGGAVPAALLPAPVRSVAGRAEVVDAGDGRAP